MQNEFERLPEETRKKLEEFDAMIGKTKPAATPAPTQDPEPKPQDEVVPATPAEPPKPTPTVDPQPAATATDRTDWKSKFLSLNGRIEAQGAELSALRNEVKHLRETNKDLTAKLAEKPATPTAPVKVLTPEEEQSLGPEMEEIMQRLRVQIRDEYRKELEQTEKKVQQREVELNANAEKQAITKFVADLAEQIPNWNEINASAQFKNWLRLYMTIEDESGAQAVVERNEHLQKMAAERNVAEVVKLFKAFIDETGFFKPAKADQPPAATVPSKESLQAPKPDAASSGRQGKPVLRQADFEQFMDDVQRGVWVKRDAEMKKRHNEFMTALREGRLK
jgi:hypothetical protein